MPRDKSITHEKIYQVMKREFLEKGFENVSMRLIGNEVGISQAALYRHYKSKEDMFDSLVEPLIDVFKKEVNNHIDIAYEGVEQDLDQNKMFATNNVTTLKKLIFQYHDEFYLLLCCSKGTKYENFVHDLVMKEQKEMMKTLDILKAKGLPIKEINEDDLHLLLSAYETALFEPIVHNWPKDKTLHSLDILEEFFIPGWKKIMGFKEGQ